MLCKIKPGHEPGLFLVVALVSGVVAMLATACAGPVGSAAVGVRESVRQRTIDVDGTERQFSYFVPEGSGNGAALPVVIYLHGHGDNMRNILGRGRFKSASAKWMDVARRERFIVVYPLGLKGKGGRRGAKTSWNDCRREIAGNSTADDIGFIRQLIGFSVDQLNADWRRVYVTGLSNGGHMTQRVALEMAEEIAAVAPVASLLPTPPTSQCAAPQVPVPYLLMNGTEDRFLPYDGGSIIADRGEVLSTRQTIDAWRQWNRLGDTRAVVERLPDIDSRDGSRVIRHTWAPSSRNSVVLYEIRGGGHTEPSLKATWGRLMLRIVGRQNHDIEMAEAIWSFFKTRSR